MGAPTKGITGLLFNPVGTVGDILFPDKPKIPRLPTPVTSNEQAPRRGEKRVQSAAQRAIAAASSRAGVGGLSSTIATGPKGLTTPAVTTQKTLLGT